MGMDNNNNNLGDLNSLAIKAREIQNQMQHELTELANKEYNSIVVGGKVKVKMLGDFTVHQVYIAPDYLPSHTAAQLSDAIALAFNNCKYDIDKEKQEIINRYQQMSNEAVIKMLGQKANDEGEN